MCRHLPHWDTEGTSQGSLLFPSPGSSQSGAKPLCTTHPLTACRAAAALCCLFCSLSSLTCCAGCRLGAKPLSSRPFPAPGHASTRRPSPVCLQRQPMSRDYFRPFRTVLSSYQRLVPPSVRIPPPVCLSSSSFAAYLGIILSHLRRCF